MNTYELAGSARKANTDWGLVLASGNRPTSAQLRSLIYGGYGFYSSDAVLTSLISTGGGKTILRMVSSALAATELTSAKLAIKLGDVAAKGVSLQNDAPTWGILFFDLRSAGSTDFQGWRAIYFTVGDENSNADMKIQGGIIPKGSEWKPNDITINFAGVI
jgi:hypothetical protein